MPSDNRTVKPSMHGCLTPDFGMCKHNRRRRFLPRRRPSVCGVRLTLLEKSLPPSGRFTYHDWLSRSPPASHMSRGASGYTDSYNPSAIALDERGNIYRMVHRSVGGTCTPAGCCLPGSILEPTLPGPICAHAWTPEDGRGRIRVHLSVRGGAPYGEATKSRTCRMAARYLPANRGCPANVVSHAGWAP
jgi:hypothetical protein